MTAMYSIAQNGMVAGNRRQEVISNNIANLTTEGFKSELAQQATMIGKGTRINGISRDLETLGEPQYTGDPLDLMIKEDGFFQVQMQNSIGYTRAGHFEPDADGQLRTPSGHLLEPSITVPADAVGFRVTEDGVVLASFADGSSQNLGEIELARFLNPNGLQSLGNNMFAETGGSGQAFLGTPGEPGFGGILSQYQEGSNTDLTDEMGSMLVNQRYIQSTLRVFQTWDAMVSRALDTFS